MGLFDEQISRKPNHYPWTQQYIDTMWHTHWTPNEFDFRSDIQQFKTELTDQEREIVTKTLSAVSQIEIAVKTFWGNLGKNLPHPAINDLGYVMANVEVIHNIAYEKLLVVLGLQDVFEKNLKEEVIQGRVAYLRKYLDKRYEDDRKQYIYALILFTLFIENVSLFSQFYTVLWFNRERSLLKDTAQQVQYTRLEEGVHALVGIKIINTLRDEYPELFDEDLENTIIEESRLALEAEYRVIDWMLGDYNFPGLNADCLKEYVKNRINTSLKQAGFNKPFKVNYDRLEETKWMDEETIGNSHTDFFHKRPVDYSRHRKVYRAEDWF